MGFHPITGWFGINNVIGWVGFNFLIVFLVGCGMDIKVTRFGYGWEWIGFFAISRPKGGQTFSEAALPAGSDATHAPSAQVASDPRASSASGATPFLHAGEQLGHADRLVPAS
jgi:hypothetical protein